MNLLCELSVSALPQTSKAGRLAFVCRALEQYGQGLLEPHLFFSSIALQSHPLCSTAGLPLWCAAGKP